jgi:tRNA-splicing ligase RtcB
MTADPASAKLHMWLAEPLPRDVAQSLDRLAAAQDIQHIAVMPDVHLAREICVGTVIATRRRIYPAAIGGDIGCGMAAIRFDASADLLAAEQSAARLLSRLYERIPSLRQPRHALPAGLPDDLPAERLSDPRLAKLAQRDGRVQLGTLGRGNHFVEFQADEQQQLWLMVHSGSRAMGQAITAHHLEWAATDASPSRLRFLDAETTAGQAYLADIDWALHYAAENRLAMVRAASQAIAELFGVATIPESLLHGHHNHVRRETHFGELLWVHRKGASPAAEGELGLIPGSMGAASFHVAGRGQEQSLRSSSHGAGRALSRTEAAHWISRKQLQRQMQGVWFDQRQTDRLRDEAPAAYKDIHAVMRAQRELVRIVRTLRPLLSYKGV